MTLPNDCFEKFLMSTKRTTTLLDKTVTYLHTQTDDSMTQNYDKIKQKTAKNTTENNAKQSIGMRVENS